MNFIGCLFTGGAFAEQYYSGASLSRTSFMVAVFIQHRNAIFYLIMNI